MKSIRNVALCTLPIFCFFAFAPQALAQEVDAGAAKGKMVTLVVYTPAGSAY